MTKENLESILKTIKLILALELKDIKNYSEEIPETHQMILEDINITRTYVKKFRYKDLNDVLGINNKEYDNNLINIITKIKNKNLQKEDFKLKNIVFYETSAGKYYCIKNEVPVLTTLALQYAKDKIYNQNNELDEISYNDLRPFEAKVRSLPKDKDVLNWLSILIKMFPNIKIINKGNTEDSVIYDIEINGSTFFIKKKEQFSSIIHLFYDFKNITNKEELYNYLTEIQNGLEMLNREEKATLRNSLNEIDTKYNLFFDCVEKNSNYNFNEDTFKYIHETLFKNRMLTIDDIANGLDKYFMEFDFNNINYLKYNLKEVKNILDLENWVNPNKLYALSNNLNLNKILPNYDTFEIMLYSAMPYINELNFNFHDTEYKDIYEAIFNLVMDQLLEQKRAIEEKYLFNSHLNATLEHSGLLPFYKKQYEIIMHNHDHYQKYINLYREKDKIKSLNPDENATFRFALDGIKITNNKLIDLEFDLSIHTKINIKYPEFESAVLYNINNNMTFEKIEEEKKNIEVQLNEINNLIAEHSKYIYPKDGHYITRY